MKKILLSLCALGLIATGAKAQTSYGLKAGVNFPKMTMSHSSGSISTKSSTSFYITGYVDAPIATNLSIQPGLSVQGKGGKSSDEGYNVKDDIMYLEIPVNFVYYIPAGTGNAFIGAGPYAGLGISAKEKINGTSTDIKFGEEPDGDGVKRFDAGLNFLLGYKLANGFLINGGYGLGLANISYGNDYGLKMKNNVFSIGVGFQF